MNFCFSSILWFQINLTISNIRSKYLIFTNNIHICIQQTSLKFSCSKLVLSSEINKRSSNPTILTENTLEKGLGRYGEGKRTLLSDFSSAVLRNKSFEMRIVNGYILCLPIYIYETIFSILKRKTITRTYWFSIKWKRIHILR